MLQSLQGNILKGHGRGHVQLLFFRFSELANGPVQGRRLLRSLAQDHISSAYRQLQDAERYKQKGIPGGLFVHLALSAKGYDAVGANTLKPQDEHFLGGMAEDERRHAPGTGSPAWEPGFTLAPHAVLLVADDKESSLNSAVVEFIELLHAHGCTLTHRQVGCALHNSVGEGIEHFGYVDGRSQPLMLAEDLQAEAEKGIDGWNPAFPLSTALVPDPAGGHSEAQFGSYLVFRKLEQNVRAFKRAELELVQHLGLKDEDAERAGALLVGRFEGGTAITQSPHAQTGSVRNDFNYQRDDNQRCPFHGHIRKTNPRTETLSEREVTMPRRGIPYEDIKRLVHPSQLPTVPAAQFESRLAPLLPEDGVGLLFMAYNRSIAEQFHVMQRHWANNPEFPAPNSGLDPIIGQGIPSATSQVLPREWDAPGRVEDGSGRACPFPSHVRLKGGEYFFSPSLGALKAL